MRTRAHGPYRHGKKWRVHFVSGSGGNRKTTYEVFASRADAQKCYDDATDEAQGITVEAAISSYIEVVRARGRAELTLVAYEGRLNLLLADYLKRPIRSIQNRGSEIYAAALDGRSADGHQNLLTAGRLWAKWCVKQRWLRVNPFAEVDPIGQRTHGADKIRLTIDESRKLEAWCLEHPEDQGAVLTLGYLYLGMRNTELGKRVVRDLDDNGSLLLIGKTKTRAGRRALRIPEPLDGLLRSLAADRPGDAPLFVDSFGRPMSANTTRDHVLRVCKAAGVPEVPPQALRRTHATISTEAGETGYAVARALGHATGATPKVTAQSYVGRGAAADAQGDRVLRVIRGGKNSR